MCSIQSLGLHEPSALPYLVAESVLPTDPRPHQYTWNLSQTLDDDNATLIEEEVLFTHACVVWSRNRSVKRVLNLNVEGESILHAFVTRFSTTELSAAANLQNKVANGPLSSERGLVVVLKTQAHIFLFSGDTHVIPLSFEVDSAFPLPSGFLLQRRLADAEGAIQDSSPSQHDLSIINETLISTGANSSRVSIVLPPPHPPSLPPVHISLTGMSRTFSFTQLMSEMGLVVWSPIRKGQPLAECKALPRSERLIFTSAHDELKRDHNDWPPLSIAVTVNEANASITLWHVIVDHGNGNRAHVVQDHKFATGQHTKRKSSHAYARDPATTPSARIPASGKGNLAADGQAHTHGYPSLPDDEKVFSGNDIAAQLGPEFGELGVQTRSTRRVSSMLARTDLGSANERTTFNDIAISHTGRQSLNRAGKRGESIGGLSDRQSFGYRRRSSFPTNVSTMSNGTSFLDASARGLLEDMDSSRQLVRLEDDSQDPRDKHLPRDVGFARIKAVPRSNTSIKPGVNDDLKVLILMPPDHSTRKNPNERDLFVSLVDKGKQEMILMQVLAKLPPDSGKKSSPLERPIELKVTEVRRISGVTDACKVVEGGIQRLVVLTQSRSKHISLHLEAPWSPSFRVELMTHFATSDPLAHARLKSQGLFKGVSTKRAIPADEIEIHGLIDAGAPSQFYALDQNGLQHSIYVQLRPGDPLVWKILQMSDLVVVSNRRESLLVAFWEVSRWLSHRDPSASSEWTVLIVLLFSLAVSYLNNQSVMPTHRRKKGALLRSSSGNPVDLTNFNNMTYEYHNISGRTPTDSPAWSWLSGRKQSGSTSVPKTKQARTASASAHEDDNQDKKNTFLLNCITLAKDYAQSPMGEAAMGPEGYLPTSVNNDREQRCNAIPSILIGLHLLFEESRLSVLSSHFMDTSKANLVLVMMQIGQWLDWKDWKYGIASYYRHETPESDSCLFDHSVIDALPMPPQPFVPPSIYEELEHWITESRPSKFLTLARVAGESGAIDLSNPIWQRTSQLTPRTLFLLALMNTEATSNGTRTALEAHFRSKIGLEELDSIPDGIAAVFYQAVAARVNDLDETAALGSISSLDHYSELRDRGGTSYVHVPKTPVPTHEALKDHHNICASAADAETNQRWDASSEADRHAITRLIFNDDRRFPEASRLVNQTRAPIVECTPEPEWTEVELLEAQKELAQHVTRRTLAVAAGRGMMHFNARVPLITERVPIPAFSLQCIMKPTNSNDSTQAMTFSAEKSAFTEEKVCWAFFHNGASMGLMIATEADGIDTSWILYNKPPELTNRHAGFLLALGLNGHLRSLAKWVAFKYLTPKHTMTSVGLLLGLSASFLGTMDTLITRLLSVHVTRLLPPGAAELNLSPLTQTTGILGIGLLYHNSQHRRMSEVMLSEIENNDPEEGFGTESVLRDEGYRLAAGFSLGLINLGQGANLHSLHDMGVMERLFAIAVGTKNVDMVHVLDRATAGAVIAIAFIFLKTNDEAVAQKVDVPDTLHQFDYVRPDIFLLRTLARHLIMWDEVKPTLDFIRHSLPAPYRLRADLKFTKVLSTEDMPFFNILGGICFAIGLRYAGSQRLDARDILVYYLDHFLRISRLPARNYDARVTLNSIRNCLDTIALATASVMAGSGDLVVMRRLRALHGRTDKDTPFGSHLAAHMALGTLFLAGGTRTFSTSDLAIASLCMAFYPVFPSDVLDNRGHLQALRHLWVLAVEGRCLVARDRNAGGAVVGGVTGIIHLRTGEVQRLRLPALIPELHTISSIEIKGDGFWDAKLDLGDVQARTALQSRIKKEKAINVNLSRRTAYDQPVQNLFAAEFQARSDRSGFPSADPYATSAGAVHNATHLGGSKTGSPFEWLFELESLSDFDHAERALVLGPGAVGDRDPLACTVVDTRLNLEQGVLFTLDNKGRHTAVRRMHKVKLWQLRLLFAWLDRWEREDEAIDQALDVQRQTLGALKEDTKPQGGEKWFNDVGGTWLRREVIERMRFRVWHMAAAGEESASP
ncbi:hypothetical protein B0A52_00617 [Exophiala mesophila]|uniref:Anaphase-promoting complex subunit 1 N-terminal domain-containing protein n=1 Tax=Exophiala mesophila TaxID=212818 RepID=A0A438NHQ4_EXOME|nr:hypothetical protein B0A52_00617 [Exophiala mesophila]